VTLQPRHITIVSGGQTGVDRGALDAALELGCRCGGWCPEGRTSEDGGIPDRYPLTELAGGGYAERTRRNVEDSDGTLILCADTPSGGTMLTLQLCQELARPVCVIDAETATVDQAGRQARAFVSARGIERLNVAGPRASEWLEGYAYAREAVRRLCSGVGGSDRFK
jgi:Circularly permutated YpsA SLOG family